MFYIVYIITNLLNNKTYIGKHKTKNLDDGYMGSGKLIKRAIEKYNLSNFKKEILHVFDNEQEMNQKEKELVVIGENSYNLCPGGHGGFGYINSNILNSSVRKQIASRSENKHKSSLSGYKNIGLKRSEEHKNNISKSLKNRVSSFKNKQHSEESKQKMRKSKNVGSNNPQFGTCWVNNGSEVKKIRKEELDFWIERGYNKGRNNATLV